jgi:phosphatidylglycerol:prolipoprotein diacylglycerol transferase
MAFAGVWPFPHISPVIVNIYGPLAVRWYGLMYLVGFLVGYVLLMRLARTGRLPLDPQRTGEFVGWIAVGVIVGGRLGYLLFYSPSTFTDPVGILRLWEGGLSFHGGLAGVILLIWWFGRRHGSNFLAIADGVVLAAPPGIAAVRLANFINGELYGRIASESVPWAMRFPSDPVARRLLGLRSSLPQDVYEAARAARLNGTWAAIEQQIPLRHPSQLYEATAEGLLLFLFLWAVVWTARRMQWKLREGFFGGLFLIGYGLARTFVENYRQPDLQFTGPGDPLGTVLGSLTMGQVLSLVVVAAGVLVLYLSHRYKRADQIAWPVRPQAQPAGGSEP